MKRRYDVLFLDFYGTLMTGDRLAVERAAAAAIEGLGLNDWTAPDLSYAWGRLFFDAIETCNGETFETLWEIELRTLREVLAPVVGEFDPQPFASIVKDYLEKPILAPYVHEALEGIKKPICIVSNADTDDIWKAVEHCNLPIEDVVTSEDARSYKPDAGIFEMALKKMGVAPDRVLHAGDSLHSDIGGATRMGISSCWVCYEDRIMDVGNDVPDHKINDLRMLWKIVND